MLFLILVNNIYHVKNWENLHSSIICPLKRELEELHRYSSFPPPPQKKPPSIFLQPGIFSDSL